MVTVHPAEPGGRHTETPESTGAEGTRDMGKHYINKE